jgi:hypothetical protein
MRFLSDEWIATASELVHDVRAPEGATARVQFVAADDAWHLAAVTGEPVIVGAGRLDDADVELRWSRPDAVRIWRRELRGDGALNRTEVSADDYVGRPAPFDLVDRPELDALPRLADASVTVQYRFAAGPFGDVHHALVFDEGRLAREHVGDVDDFDVRVNVAYEDIAYVRAGERSILEALEHGSIEGEIGPMAVLAGILESPAFQDAERALSPHGFALAALGRLDVDPGYTTAMEALANRTDPE